MFIVRKTDNDDENKWIPTHDLTLIWTKAPTPLLGRGALHWGQTVLEQDLTSALRKTKKSAPEFHVLSSVASEYISFKFSVWYQRAGTNKPLLNDWGVASVQSYIHKYKKKSEMPELLTLVMIDNSSKNLIIRPSESIKPELLDERILDMTKIVKWSTFRSGLSQLKSRIA